VGAKFGELEGKLDKIVDIEKIGSAKQDTKDNALYYPAKSLSDRSCAVVFNSGVMLKEKAGTLIDSFDEVFRMNMHPIAGFEDYVGSKTTYQALQFFPMHFNQCKCLPHVNKGKCSAAELFADSNYSGVEGLSFLNSKHETKYHHDRTREVYDMCRKRHPKWILVNSSFSAKCAYLFLGLVGWAQRCDLLVLCSFTFILFVLLFLSLMYKVRVRSACHGTNGALLVCLQ
jgi:hypothetical protein